MDENLASVITTGQGRTYWFWLGGCNHEMRPTHHWNVNRDRLSVVSWCVAIKLSTKHGNSCHLLGILQETYSLLWDIVFLLSVRALSVSSTDYQFRRDRSCLLDRAHMHARVQSSPRRSWFITERVTVSNNFSFEKLRSADANVTGTVRRVTRIFDWPRHFWRGGMSGGMLPGKFLIF
jgi:hypothetical protein